MSESRTDGLLAGCLNFWGGLIALVASEALSALAPASAVLSTLGAVFAAIGLAQLGLAAFASDRALDRMQGIRFAGVRRAWRTPRET